ncbi:ABC transporter substrate-binding protein [Kiloniella sp. EL199]|uniref:substrate-binding periplasmic protein n=1 Tax=Kiloniella sp. EL199 TaxID=2107581 RepID=UPI000EA00BB2|nr:transporter substrate-binding domain-containing protein [Kiloniella sp. EL199]
MSAKWIFKCILFSLFITLPLAIALLLAISSAKAQSLVEIQKRKLLVASIDWCPQLCPKAKQEGYIMDTVKEIFAESPYELEIVTYPWSRSIYMTRMGEVHALLSPARAEAPDLLYPKEEVGAQKMCFFASRGSAWTYQGEASLKGQMIGIAHDTSIEELNDYIAENKEGFHFLTYGPRYLPLSFRMVDGRRLNSFLFTYNSTVYALKKEGYADKIVSAGCVSKANVYMAFTPDLNKRAFVLEAMEYFDQKMKALVQAGRVPEIMKAYGLPDWKGALPSVF